MLLVDANDEEVLKSSLKELSLDDVAHTEIKGSGVVLSLPSFNDEQIVMDDLDFRGVGFTYLG